MIIFQVFDTGIDVYRQLFRMVSGCLHVSITKHNIGFVLNFETLLIFLYFKEFSFSSFCIDKMYYVTPIPIFMAIIPSKCGFVFSWIFYRNLIAISANVPAIIRQSSISSDINDEEASREPLLGTSAADNSIYLRSPDTTEPTHKPSKKNHPAVNGTNPVYMSNNNGSPVAKQPPSHDYNNIDYVNQPRQHPVWRWGYWKFYLLI